VKEVRVSLPDTATIQQFARALVPLDGDFELVSAHAILDARSFMGIFAFDLTRPIRLKIYNDTPENLKAIRPFMASEEARP
jgi:hypothetical protein